MPIVIDFSKGFNMGEMNKLIDNLPCSETDGGEDVIAEKILRETIYEQIDKHWNEVLFDGEKCVHVYSIPDEMYVCIWNQIYETLEHLILKYKRHFGYRNDAINAMCKKVNLI